MPKSKSQTPEFRRILARIKNKKKEKAQLEKKKEENIIEKPSQKTDLNLEKINTDKNLTFLVEEKQKENPPSKPPLPKIGVGGGKKKNKGKKFECVNDKTQPKIDDLWNVKLKTRENKP